VDLRVKDRVLEILTNHGQLAREDIGMSSTLESLGIDSVGVVEVIFAIEEEFDINIPYNANETLSKRLDFSNVLSVVELVSELVRDNHKF
tara:strand:- start:505 stop:774 length:270 start_codon:yes stop_codon:yes gene_type:complete